MSSAANLAWSLRMIDGYIYMIIMITIIRRIVLIIVVIIMIIIYIYLCLQETLNWMRKSFKTYFLLGVQYIVCSVNNINQKRVGRKKNLLQPCRPSL